MSSAPASFSADTHGVLAGNYLYFFRGSNVSTFYRYNPADDSWATLTNAPANVYNGGSLAYPGSGDYLYATRGNTTGTFWRYSISNNSWDTSLPAIPDGTISSYGSHLLSDGTDIYFTGGSGVKRMFKYDISGDSWTELAQLPFSPYWGTSMTYHDGTFIALAGYYKTDVYLYRIADDSWSTLPSLPAYSATEVGAWSGASIAYDPNGDQFYVSRGAVGGIGSSQILTLALDGQMYPAIGSWISQPYDLQYVDSWTSLTSTTQTPLDSAVVFQTRSSSDGNTWTGWEDVIGSSIASPPNRYIQIRAALYATSDQSKTPLIEDISITYVGDEIPPSNPTSTSGFSQQINGENLVDGASYKFPNPFFTWTGATDDETEVKGYYVYFGSNEVADPLTEGSFVTNAQYRVNQPLTSGLYYLRLATVDSLDNTSISQTMFTYDYTGVSPAQANTFSQSGDFLGTSEGTSTAENEISLESLGGGFWLEEKLTLPPATIQYGGKGAAYIESEGKIYLLRGANDATFYSYDVADDSWTTLADAPDTARYGTEVVGGPPGYLYAIRGNASTDFWRYHIATDTWDASVANAPLPINYGGSLVFDGSRYIYILRGNNTNSFWRYDTSSDEWQTLSSVDFGAPNNNYVNNAYTSADMTIDRDNQLIYVTQGNQYPGFSVYNILDDTWTVLNNLPSLPLSGSSLEFDPVTHAVYFTAGNSLLHFFKYDVTTQEWTQLQSSPDALLYGGGTVLVGDKLYTFRGGNATGFYKYSISKNTWYLPTTGLFGRRFEASSIFTIGDGSDIVQGDGDYFYLTRGLYADDFVRWNQKTGEVTRLANTPVGTYQGSTMVYDSTDNVLYLTGGPYTQKFYKYDIANNIWSEVASDPTPALMSYGSSMAYDGNRYIYLSRGANTTAFYRYDKQATAGSRWTTLANAPAALGYGAKLVLRGGSIYTLRGQSVADNPLYRYDIDTNTWDTSLAPMLTPIQRDGFLVDGNDGYLYAARATNTDEFYRYSLSGDSWEKIASFPAPVSNGGSAESNLVNKIFAFTGTGTNSYSDGLYTYIMQTGQSGFVGSGTYVSQIHDLSSVYRWASLQVSQQTPQNTSIEIFTRSSADGVTWGEWMKVSQQEHRGGNSYQYKINSQADQFIQVRFDLESGDNILTPRIGSYTLNYYQDNTPPSNPTNAGLSVLSAENDGVVLISDAWYNHPSPVFSWVEAEQTNGATDGVGGSGVSGYYVYFGTDALADPETAGSFQIGTKFQANGLTNAQNYYLRIKTLDEAGNVSSAVWAPFIYKYDANEPGAPSTVTANPSGFTATNSFAFLWNEAVSEGADVVSYCYKTNATDGPYAQDQCIAGTTISNIPASKVGTNTFSVRALDEAGNYSPYATVSYFYADVSSAPAPPQNLSVTPATNTTNAFSFSWEQPADGTFLGSASNLLYRYSINAVPTALSTSVTSLTYLNPGPFATMPGENVFYLVAQDEAGNVNYNSYAQVSFFANTVAPGIPVNIEIADVSVKSTASWRLAISWDEPTSTGSGISSYQIYRSTDNTNFILQSTTSGESFVDTKLDQVTYYYKVRACDNTNNCGAFSGVVELLPDGRYTEPAELIAKPAATNISTKKATVQWTTARTSDSRVAFGTEPGKYFDEEVSSSEYVSNHILALNNLSPGTTYYFVARWTDEDGNRGESEESSFTTSPPPSTEVPVTRSIGLTSAIIEFVSRNAAKVKIYYGESSSFGGVKEVSTGLAEGTYTVELDGLLDGTEYFFKINPIDIDGSEYEGETHSFKTLPRPEISGISIVQVQGTAQTTLLLRWVSNTAISSIVTYYPTNQPERALDEVNIALREGQNRMILYNLEPQQQYTIVIRGRDIAGNEAVSQPQIITTAADTRPPQILDFDVESEVIGEGDEAIAQLIVSYKTDEPATSQVEYGEGTGGTYGQKTQEDLTLKSSHLVIVSGLQPSKVYHVRALSKDEVGNESKSIEKAIVTPKATENALDLVLSNLDFIFGFLRK